MVAEFEADLTRTREGMAIAKVACKLRGHKPKLPPVAGEAPGAAAPYRCPHDQRKSEPFGVARLMVCRAIQRAAIRPRSTRRCVRMTLGSGRCPPGTCQAGT